MSVGGKTLTLRENGMLPGCALCIRRRRRCRGQDRMKGKGWRPTWTDSHRKLPELDAGLASEEQVWPGKSGTLSPAATHLKWGRGG